MKKTFNYRKFIYKHILGDKISSRQCRTQMTFNTPAQLYLKKIIEAFRNNDIVFLQSECKRAMSVDILLAMKNRNQSVDN